MTVGKLCDLGLATTQLGLVTRRAHVQGLLSFAPAGAERRLMERLLEDIDPLPSPEFGDVVASRGPVRTLLDLCGSKLVLGKNAAHPSTVVGPDLGAHLRAGATALAVSANSSEQQWASARILLEQSVFPVLTHEFRLTDGQ